MAKELKKHYSARELSGFLSSDISSASRGNPS